MKLMFLMMTKKIFTLKRQKCKIKTVKLVYTQYSENNLFSRKDCFTLRWVGTVYLNLILTNITEISGKFKTTVCRATLTLFVFICSVFINRLVKFRTFQKTSFYEKNIMYTRNSVCCRRLVVSHGILPDFIK